MRIIAGTLGGRRFQSPRGHRTHPMSDKARGALFNTLGDITGLTVLDAFAGSGALSFEAVSRGAAHATTIDRDRSAQQTIAANVKSLGLSQQVKLIKAPAASWLKTTDQQFDLILLDPPYNELQVELMLRIANRATDRGLVIFSLPPPGEIHLPNNFELVSSKNYGDAQLVFYRKIS